MRPTSVYNNGTVNWTVLTYDVSGVLVDADASPAPAITVRRNNTSLGVNATVTKRSATTGKYDCSYQISGASTGDYYVFEEKFYINSIAYDNNFTVLVNDSGYVKQSDLSTTQTAITSAITSSKIALMTAVSGISISGGSSGPVDLTSDALGDIANIFGNNPNGLVYNIQNKQYITTMT